MVGTRGRSGAARIFLGSVAEAVLRTAHTDVLGVGLTAKKADPNLISCERSASPTFAAEQTKVWEMAVSSLSLHV